MSAAREQESGDQRYSREGCECDRMGRSELDECIYSDPCPTHSVGRAASVSNERVLEALTALWTGVPYMRFGQMVMNLSRIDGGFADTWEWSNETWLAKVEEGMRTWAK